jgi:hypothetical protein
MQTVVDETGASITYRQYGGVGQGHAEGVHHIEPE